MSFSIVHDVAMKSQLHTRNTKTPAESTDSFVQNTGAASFPKSRLRKPCLTWNQVVCWSLWKQPP